MQCVIIIDRELTKASTSDKNLEDSHRPSREIGMSIFKNIIDVAAGLMGILFEKYEGSGDPETGTVTSQADDLTQIDGIGPTFARRLEEAGITTYVQLAELSPEQAREITRVTVQSDPADWIAEANSLS
jgi:hypothetical protein